MFKLNKKGLYVKFMSVLIGFTLTYKAILFTTPFILDKLQTLSVVSASLSFLDGGVVLAKQTMTEIKSPHDNKTDTENTVITAQNNPKPQEDKEQEQTTPTNESENTKTELVNIQKEPPAPARPQNAGDVYDNQVKKANNSTFVDLEYGSVKNISSLSPNEIVQLSQNPSPITLEDTTAPQVLIYHTHATESYQPYDCDWYDLSYNARNVDNQKNMVAVGNVLEQKLKQAGIGVIHDTTQHDNPSYTGAYSRSQTTIKSYLEKYPSIKVILDVHRDALQGDNFITAPTVSLDGKKVAQIMIVSTHDDNTGTQPNYRENFKFASNIQKTLEKEHPTITRPMLFDDRNYNQELSIGALLVEVGGHGNTLSEAQYAMEYFSDALIKVLKKQV